MLQQPQPPLPLGCGWEARSGVNAPGRWKGPVPRYQPGSRRRRGPESAEPPALASLAVHPAGRAASRAAGSRAARPRRGGPGGAGHAWRAGPAGKGHVPLTCAPGIGSGPAYIGGGAGAAPFSQERSVSPEGRASGHRPE